MSQVGQVSETFKGGTWNLSYPGFFAFSRPLANALHRPCRHAATALKSCRFRNREMKPLEVGP